MTFQLPIFEQMSDKTMQIQEKGCNLILLWKLRSCYPSTKRFKQGKKNLI